MNAKVAALLAALKEHRMPLVRGKAIQNDLRATDIQPASAYAGLLLYLGDWERAHATSQDIETADGSYWHAIVHRQEPDPGNSGYWFRQVGDHAIYPALREDALALLERFPAPLKVGSVWNPHTFIEFCEAARQKPGSPEEKTAIEIQHAEWRRLFEWCIKISK